MSNFIKVILGIIGGLTVTALVLAAVAVGMVACTGKTIVDSLLTSPEEADQIAAEIAEFELPEGYHTQYGASAMGISLAAYTSDNPNTHIFVAQAGPDSTIDMDEVQKMLKDSGKGNDTNYTRVKLVSQDTITVRGKPAQRAISEGTNSEGETYRTVNILFEGKGGPAVVSIAAPLTAWDEEAFNSFVESIQ